MASERPRKVVFIDKRFQSQFILKFIVLMLVGTAVFGVSAYLILNRRLDESYYAAHLSIRSVGEILKPTLVWLSLVFVGVFGVAAAVVTLYVSHHIAGPLFAIRRYLEKVSRGDLDFEPHLRAKDQTTPLALSLSHAIETLNARLVTIRSGADAVQEATAKLSAHLATGAPGSEDCRRDMSALIARCEELHREIDFFALRRGGDRG